MLVVCSLPVCRYMTLPLLPRSPPLTCPTPLPRPTHMQVVHQMRVFAEAEYEEAAEEHGLRDKLAALEELCETQVGAAGHDA